MPPGEVSYGKKKPRLSQGLIKIRAVLPYGLRVGVYAVNINANSFFWSLFMDDYLKVNNHHQRWWLECQAPIRGLKTFLGFAAFRLAPISCFDCFPLYLFYMNLCPNILRPFFMFFLWHSRHYMTTAKGGGFLSLNKKQHTLSRRSTRDTPIAGTLCRY
jgi:hypothetical protein